ncbi:putative rnase p rpr2 rpp21 snm1 subunit domain-containing protein [Erysiphe neolycopersici]|uniref:Putative rnase p rpr2 rpp21 snm1 subunit domain-containing protein n=1 Tax=Erysiphe neolycopersici TaxID=212602 RepID=A0A420HVE3_9PEZI|nr:putative rnase p rpr2 rpp21 snm1 subunit domain-containing protein [Erysiphe neolycopersici]
MTTTETSARIRFLNQSAQLLFKSAPETSRYLMTKRNKLALDNNVDITETKLSRTCNACGSLMIIGWHGAISIDPGIHKRQKKHPKKMENKKQPRALIYECNTCHRKTRQNLGFRLRTVKERKSLKISTLQTEDLPNNCEPRPKTQNNSMLASNTRKRRRTKKNTLETLIEQKRNPQSTSYGFDLMDFLKKP